MHLCTVVLLATRLTELHVCAANLLGRQQCPGISDLQVTYNAAMQLLDCFAAAKTVTLSTATFRPVFLDKEEAAPVLSGQLATGFTSGLLCAAVRCKQSASWGWPTSDTPRQAQLLRYAVSR